MALANCLGLIFSTMSVAHAFNDIVEMRALIYPSTEFNKKRGLKAPSLETAPAYHYKYAEGSSKVHICVHAATVGSLIWSLALVQETRRISSAALVFELASLAISPWLLSVMEEIFAARSDRAIGAGLTKLIGRQLVRNAFLHVPCMLCCLMAVMRLMK